MIKQSDIDLMNRVIDGLANADEQEEVRALLNRDSSARQYFDSLVLASTQLAKVPRVAPPANLKANVMAGLAAHKSPAPAREQQSLELFAYLREQWKRNTSFNLAVGSLVGAAAVVLVVSVLSGSGHVSNGNLQGTIGAGKKTMPIMLTSGTVSAGHSNAQFELSRSGNILTANILANSADVAQVTVGFDHSDLRITSVTAEGNPISPQSTGDQILFTATPGTTYVVTFEDLSPELSTLTVEITDDQLTARQEISTGSGVPVEQK